jgi:hypothetical protein
LHEAAGVERRQRLGLAGCEADARGEQHQRVEFFVVEAGGVLKGVVAMLDRTGEAATQRPVGPGVALEMGEGECKRSTAEWSTSSSTVIVQWS